MKNGLDRNKILAAAVEIADESGFQSLTLKTLADRLGIKSPSLYKHFRRGLEELHEELMLYGWRCMEKEVVDAAVGKAREDALLSICKAYRTFACRHKGLYEAMQWYNMYLSDKHLKATEGLVSVMFRVLDAYELEEEQIVHIVRMLRSFLQGFSTIESHGGYGNPVTTDASFDFAVKTLINGISDIREAAQ